MTVQEARQQLERARSGDEDAVRSVALWVFERYRDRLNKFFQPVDPAVELTDLESVFFEGILRSVTKADDRGDPLYHIGQRGIWAVRSYLRQVQSIVDKRIWPVVTPDTEDIDWVEQVSDPNVEDFSEIVCEQAGASQRWQLIATADVADPRVKQCIGILQSGTLNLEDSAFNKRLAEAMGVSPQRSSQIMGKVRRLAENSAQ